MLKKGKILIILLALTTVFAGFAGAESEARALPAAGDAVEGFTVKETTSFPLVNADVVLFEHDKTGALLMYIANEDTNRVFETTFRTPALNDTGISHVFEHSTLDGSEKYPSKSLFFNLSYQTYNTYINAATYPFMTTFPIASLSEAQLLKYADYYTDSVLNPLAGEDEGIFLEEAWRYELTDAEAELSIAGTVYSEMKGAYTIERAARMNAYKTLFPGSNAGNDSGGDPEHIPEMEWADLKAYHEAYYHPSNSLTCLYGSFEDYTAFLRLLNGYFSAYEKREFVIADEGYTPIEAPALASFEYGVEAGSDTANGAVAQYALLCQGATDEDMNVIDLLTTLIGEDSSKVMEALKKALPTAEASCYVEITGPELAVIFSATGMNPGEETTFKATIDAALEEIAREGFSKEEIDAVMSSMRLSVMLTAEDSDVGVNLIPSIVYYWAGTGHVFGYMDYLACLDKFDAYAEDGTFAAAINRFLIGNDQYALTVTSPAAGMKEEKDAALAARLKQVKAQMTPEQISALVARTAAYAGETADDASEYIAQLQAVTVESLPEEIRIYDIDDGMLENGVRRVTAQADIAGVGNAMVFFDASGMPQEYLHALKLYTDLIGELDTDAHTSAQLAALINRYLYGGVIRVSIVENKQENSFTPYLRAGWTCLDADLPAAYQLLDELLFATKLDDAEEIAKLITKTKTSLKQSITNESFNIQAYRAFATADASYACYNYVNNLDYYDFLCRAEALIAQDPQAMLDALTNIREYLYCATGAISCFSGNAESIALNDAAAAEFFAGMPEEARERAEYAFPAIADAEALIVDGSVMYNLIFASYEDLGLDEFTGDLDAVTALVSDTFLYPMLRDQYGAYGVMHYATDDGVYIISYRDPNIAETFAAYQTLPSLIADMAVTQDTLNGYILSSYSAYAKSAGELTGAQSAILNHINGIAQEKTLEYMHELKTLTPEKFASYARLYQSLAEQGMISTSGSASAIGGCAELYEAVLNPFGAVDATQVVLTDVPEDAPHYDAIRFVFENMLMSAETETTFGADSPATLGDMAVAMYGLLGGSAGAEDAIAFLAGYGILPAEAPDTQLTNEQMIVYSYYFAQGMGADVTVNVLNELSAYADADQLSMEDADAAYCWSIGNGVYEADGALNPQATATRAELAELISRF